MSEKKYILKGILQGPCKCGNCNVPSYPGRIYDKVWSCEKQMWVKDTSNSLFMNQLKDYEKGKKKD